MTQPDVERRANDKDRRGTGENREPDPVAMNEVNGHERELIVRGILEPGGRVTGSIEIIVVRVRLPRLDICVENSRQTGRESLIIKRREINERTCEIGSLGQVLFCER